AYTEEEIKILLKESKAEGIIEQREEEMFNKVFEFTDTVVREIMTPRIEIIGVESGASLNEAVQIVIEHKTSKLPVYEESVDNIKGYIHSTDLLKVLSESEQDITVVDELIRPIMKVPESKPIADLLAEFKRDRVQIAIVLDEFGGTDGLVTLEDIVEELVGDIQDEDELPEEPIVEVEDGGYLIESRVPISEVNESLETRLSEEHFDTIGGYVFGLIGREPRIGDEVEDLDWTFKVEKLDEHNIKQIKAIPNINNSSDELSEETNNINGAIET
ncbi:MAG TPA: hemolysin family protein, partial [Vampirovibrionales bacterium]